MTFIRLPLVVICFCHYSATNEIVNELLNVIDLSNSQLGLLLTLLSTHKYVKKLL